MFMKRLLAAACAGLLAVSVLSGTAACEEETSDTQVLEHFYELTQIPRTSHHEEQISNYLKHWAEERGFEVTQDAWNNIVFDVPATEGMENKPLTALQGHMDMVFAQQEGLNLDPLTTTIEHQDDGVWVRSDGRTSIGADDGLGVAIIMSVADGRMAHGPLRMIITVDEEDSLTGISNISPQVVDGVKYLINVDYEVEGVVMVSSVAGYDAYFTVEYTPEAAKKECGMSLELKELSGGHSGVQINENRLNAIVAMGSMLKALEDEGIDFELAEMNGGTARNAIAADARATINLDAAELDHAEGVLNEVFTALQQEHAETDPNMTLELVIDRAAAKVLPEAAKAAAIAFVNELPNGVYTMHPTVEDLVECSSNLGVVNTDENDMVFHVLERSSNQDKMDELTDVQKALAESLGIKVVGKQTGEAWQYKEDNHLLDLTKEAYEKLFNKEILAQAVHAGLECGDFSRMNEEMDIISIGPTIVNPHTVDECFEIASVDSVWQLVEQILADVD